MYAEGQGVPQDHAEAARWYRKAADQGNALAQFGLGLMYDQGHGVAAGPTPRPPAGSAKPPTKETLSPS
jgi:TPR repeat protein